MTTLFNALLNAARYAGITQSGRSTSLGTTALTLIDTNRYENDDYYNNGTLFIRTGTQANNTRRITDYAQVTGTITFTPAFAAAIASGVEYTITNASREQLSQAVNQALLEMGRYTMVNIALEVTPNQRDYDLPDGVSSVVRVEIAVDQTDYTIYRPHFTWREIDGELHFPGPLSYNQGNKIRLYYNGSHDEVHDDDDVIQNNYNLTRLAWTSAHLYLLGRMQYSGNLDEREMFLLQNAAAQAEKYARIHPIKSMNRDPIFARW